MSRQRFSVLPLAAVLVAAPFFGNYRDEPLRFGLLQGLLVVCISVAAAGGFQLWRERLQSPGYCAFWAALVSASVAAPFLVQKL